MRHLIRPIGIDLGTTYSSISYLNGQGAPVTIPNEAGELTTPSVVLFDGDEVAIGGEALRNSLLSPARVVTQSKRFMGDRQKCWIMDGQVYRPRDIATLILRSLLQAAEPHVGTVRHAVITVPAQFSDLQRGDTIAAGQAAGLERVDLIAEPVAASLCHILGEGMWFAELAEDQTVLVFDLGGGTFDLSLVRYRREAEVRVLATGGDLRLGGLDWNHALSEYLCDQFVRSSISDPRLDPESMQTLALEVEQVKRSLSQRARTVATVVHDGRRKAFPVEREHFEVLARPLVSRLEKVTLDLLRSQQVGWAKVDSVLITGGASRMPMVQSMLKRISGSTRNQILSPDQSICHGAAYYAGMLLSGRKFGPSTLAPQAEQRLQSVRQHSVAARSLGVIVKDLESGERRPHYLIPSQSPLPCAFRQTFGTVTAGQSRVHLRLVESGAGDADAPVELGDCTISGLPENLPLGAPIDVTLRYDEQARVHLEAVDRTSGATARTSIVRTPEPKTPAAPPGSPESAASAQPRPMKASIPAPEGVALRPENWVDQLFESVEVEVVEGTLRSEAAPKQGVRPTALEEAQAPIPLCQRCGEPLDAQRRCRNCGRKNFDDSTEPMAFPPEVKPRALPKIRRSEQDRRP